MDQQDKENCQEPIMEDETARSEAPPGLSANGRILVKLKLPKMPEEEEEERKAEVETGLAEEIKSHYCKECDKSFSSGKALGGHMSSAHVQANKDHSIKKLKSKMNGQNKSAGGSTSGSAGVNSCMLCEKHFPSKKSLFGHMRCHPERDWRGMAPPSGQKIESSEASSDPGLEDVGLNQEGDDDDQIDSVPDVVAPTEGVGNTLKGWPMTAKRGRWQTKPGIDSPPVSSSEEKEAFVAGHQLIRLLKGDSGKQNVGEAEGMSSSSLPPQGDKLDAGDHCKKQKRDSCEQKLKICEREAIQGPELETVDQACEFKKRKRVSSVQKLRICEREAIDDGVQFRRKIEINGKGKEKINYKGKTKTVLLEPEKSVSTSCLPDGIDSDDELYLTAINVLVNGKRVEGAKCHTDTQEKVVEENIMPIDSKATINGLMNGKRVEGAKCRIDTQKKVVEENVMPTDSKTAAAELNPIQQKGDSGTLTPEKYICNTCNRSFPTHQALGGHRSSHNKFKMSIVNTMDVRANAAVLKEDQNAKIVANNLGVNIASEQSGIPVDDANSHLCNICYKTFPTGQALGGHKRCHSAADDNNKTAQKVVLDIDLNEVPIQEDDEYGAQYKDAAGDPSSHASNF